jgi:PAS domain S-box-containing protein
MPHTTAITIRSQRLERSLLGMALLLLAIGLALWRWHDRALVDGVERAHLQAQADGLAEQLRLTLRAADNALQSVRAESAAGRPLEGLPSSRLGVLVDAVASIDGLYLIDAKGLVRGSSGAYVPAALAAQPCFERAKASPNPDVLYLCEPFRAANGTWVTALMRGMVDADAHFAGTVAATLDGPYLSAILSSALYAADIRALLMHGDGIIFLSSMAELAPGTDLSKLPNGLFARYRASGQASSVIEGTGMVTKQGILDAFYAVVPEGLRMEKPLVLSVARGVQAIYRGWRLANWATGVAWLLTALAAGLSLHLSQRRRRAQAEQSSRLARERLDELELVELIVGGADLSLWVWHVDDDRFDSDERWCAMVGIAGGPRSAPAEVWRRRIHPDDLDRLTDTMARHLEGQTTLAEYEYRIRHEQGHWVWVHGRGKVVERSASGEPRRVAGTHQDITERKAADQALRDSEAQLREVAGAMPAALGRFDLQRRFIFANATFERWLGAAPQTLIGRTLSEAFGADALTAWESQVRRVETGERLAFETSFESPTMGAMHVLVTLVPDLDEAGVACGHFAVVSDITLRRAAEAERRALEDHLREAQRMESIGTLAGGIAHDFNNVLGAIIGNAELAKEEIGPQHAALASLQQVSQAAQRARGLVQQILTFSRKQPQARVNQPLLPLVEETVTMLRATLPARVTLVSELTAVPLYVDADATQVHQVLMNLGTNAWHALQGSTGRIAIGLESVLLDDAGPDAVQALPGGQYAHLWISDNGVGMDAATCKRIFEPFFTTKPVGQGTGLGLSVVHGIVRSHLGAITVESVPGRGTHFHVYLPAELHPSQMGDLDEADEPPRRGLGQHVMYVDDDETMVLLVERLLERAGYRVTTCANARQAMAAFFDRPHDFDLLVTDFNMPELSGLALAAEFLRLRPDLPVVISSGFLGEELSTGAQRAGIRHLMQKQNTFEELADLVHQALAEAQRESVY